VSHSIEGFIVAEAALGSSPVRRTKRPQGFAFVDVRTLVVAGDESTAGFRQLTQPVVDFAMHLSRASAVAYIETDYFGGAGGQSAIVWRDGQVVFGPANGEAGPINEALQVLGVHADGEGDEFDALGLGKVRATGDFFA
jgi:hypothetical protein